MAEELWALDCADEELALCCPWPDAGDGKEALLGEPALGDELAEELELLDWLLWLLLLLDDELLAGEDDCRLELDDGAGGLGLDELWLELDEDGGIGGELLDELWLVDSHATRDRAIATHRADLDKVLQSNFIT